MRITCLTILLGIVLVTGADKAGADMVILKSGEIFQTQRAWKENGVVMYYQNGRVVRVQENDVERLIHSSMPDEDHIPADARPPAAPLSPPEDADAVQPLPAGGDAGYLDLKWGQPLAQMEGLKLIGTDPAYGGVLQYIEQPGKKRFGRAQVDNIFYGFWQGGLYTILVETSNYLDFLDLKAEAFRRYGQGGQQTGDMEKYRWKDRGTDRLLSYDDDSDTGYLWMRSQALHEKVKARYPE